MYGPQRILGKQKFLVRKGEKLGKEGELKGREWKGTFGKR